MVLINKIKYYLLFTFFLAGLLSLNCKNDIIIDFGGDFQNDKLKIMYNNKSIINIDSMPSSTSLGMSSMYINVCKQRNNFTINTNLFKSRIILKRKSKDNFLSVTINDKNIFLNLDSNVAQIIIVNYNDSIYPIYNNTILEND